MIHTSYSILFMTQHVSVYHPYWGTIVMVWNFLNLKENLMQICCSFKSASF